MTKINYFYNLESLHKKEQGLLKSLQHIPIVASIKKNNLNQIDIS
jgi:hypothetical protein